MSKSPWHDPTDWVIANYPWPAASSCTASGLTEAARPPSLLRLRPEDFGLGLVSPLSRQVLTAPGVDGQTEQRPRTEQSVRDDENLLIYHQQQQQQQLGIHDNELVIDPLVFYQSILVFKAISLHSRPN